MQRISRAADLDAARIHQLHTARFANQSRVDLCEARSSPAENPAHRDRTAESREYGEALDARLRDDAARHRHPNDGHPIARVHLLDRELERRKGAGRCGLHVDEEADLRCTVASEDLLTTRHDGRVLVNGLLVGIQKNGTRIKKKYAWHDLHVPRPSIISQQTVCIGISYGGLSRNCDPIGCKDLANLRRNLAARVGVVDRFNLSCI